MKKTILLSALVGLFGFAMTFLLNAGHNLLVTSLLRGLFGFIIWFALAFLLGWVLRYITKPAGSPEASAADAEGGEGLGAKLDISTPDEDQEMMDLLTPKPAQREENDIPFQPLQPPKLVSMNNPEELAKAVRHLKEE